MVLQKLYTELERGDMRAYRKGKGRTDLPPVCVSDWYETVVKLARTVLPAPAQGIFQAVEKDMGMLD